MTAVSLRTLCFLRDGTRVLLLRRRKPPNLGLWNGVGGKIETGEDPYAACLREVAEETALAITDPQVRALLIVDVLTPPALWVIFVFVAAVPGGAPVGSDEGELAWVDLAMVPSLPTPPDLPLVLPRVFTTDEVLIVRAEYRTEDPTSLTHLEVVGS